ncbi:hypothetical protein [Couchioplanes caeruleus]|nr:hypothetical protein [Couchioplanes caeruleus]
MKATTVAAWLGLAVSILSLWLGVVRTWLKDRAATPRVQLDLIRAQLKSGPTNEVRLLVTNQGPAVMKQVNVQVFDEDGKSLELTEPDVSALWPKMPVRELHPNQSLYLTLTRSLATRDARQALVRWHDRRRGQQSSMIPLSYNRI